MEKPASNQPHQWPRTQRRSITPSCLSIRRRSIFRDAASRTSALRGFLTSFPRVVTLGALTLRKPPLANTPQPSPAAAETLNAGGYNSFTERQTLPSFNNLTSLGLESFNTQNMLGQGAADPPAAPANMWLLPPLEDINEIVTRFEAYRKPPPLPPEDSSPEEEEGEFPGRKRAQRQEPNHDIPRIRVSAFFSLPASPTGPNHKGDARWDSTKYRFIHPVGAIDADYDSDSSLAELEEDELYREMALNQPGAGHDSDEDDEESRIPNRGGRDSDYDGSPLRRNRMPETRRRPGSPLRLDNQRAAPKP